MHQLSESDLVQLDEYVPEEEGELDAERFGAQSKRRRSTRSRKRK